MFIKYFNVNDAENQKKKAIVNKLNVIQIYLFLMTIIYKQYANKFIKWFGNLHLFLLLYFYF